MLKTLSFSLLGFLLLAGCYRMPTEDDYSVIPATNHPDIVHDQGNNSFVPNLKY
ncbi:hypothetical protein PHSC3_001172 [Chlamydiales bacterium STE3]|nr:hypothetical protein PHSC3_001172 [Chlamydiales bacterium STE3]